MGGEVGEEGVALWEGVWCFGRWLGWEGCAVGMVWREVRYQVLEMGVETGFPLGWVIVSV